MHMIDSLLSPVVMGTMYTATAGVAAYSIKKIQNEIDDKKVPLMGVMGAFVFAAQMINFSIPGTGSSGHIGGGLLLAILLGPYAGFLTMASVLLIQALFFADGGLLAYGANVFNLGFYTCFIVYPMIFKGFIKKGYSSKKIVTASIVAAVVGLQLGAFSVVLETVISGKIDLSFSTFFTSMQLIHLAIGIVEGLVTAAVVSFVWKARPEIIEKSSSGKSIGGISIKKVFIVLSVSVIIIGGALSWFASSNPDGLEWSLIKTSGTAEPSISGSIYDKFKSIQDKLSFLPDYSFKASKSEKSTVQMPKSNTGTSAAGIIGSAMTLGVVALTGVAIGYIKRRKREQT